MPPKLSDGHYPFIDEMLPLAQLTMVEAPPEMEELLRSQAAMNGIEILRDTPVEITCKAPQFPNDARFLVYWPAGDRMHMLVPKDRAKGRA